MKLTALASLVQGEIIGDQDPEISGVSGILEAKEGDITFLSSNKYANSWQFCAVARTTLLLYVQQMLVISRLLATNDSENT